MTPEPGSKPAAAGTPLPDHVISIHINVPVQRVWDEITKTGKVQRALYNTVLESDLVPGGGDLADQRGFGQRDGAVNLRFALAEQVQIGAVEHMEPRRSGSRWSLCLPRHLAPRSAVERTFGHRRQVGNRMPPWQQPMTRPERCLTGPAPRTPSRPGSS